MEERLLQPPHVNRAMTPLEWTMLVALSAVWGGAFFFNAVAVKELPVLRWSSPVSPWPRWSWSQP